MMKKKRIFWGLFFILGAVVVIVSKLGFFGDIGLWTIFLTVFLVATLIQSVSYRSYSGICFSIAILCILYAKPLGITAITPWPVLGAALLGSIGCALLFRPWRHYKCYHQNEDFATETVEGDCINLNTSFGGSVKYINSGDLKKACLSCSFASMKVYFDHAVIQGDEAFVELNASFCGVELFVPREWRVESQASMSFGGIEEKNRNASTGTPVLHLTGHCSFGGVTIIYV